MNYKVFTLYAGIVLLWAACMGCGGLHSGSSMPGSETETVYFSLPEYPADTRPELTGWLVTVLKDAVPQTVRLDAAAESFSVTMPKNKPVPVKVYPITKSGSSSVRFFFPAGCIYPAAAELTWQNGFAADILHTILSGARNFEEAQRFCSFFNWSRLNSEIDRILNGSPDTIFSADPWRIDSRRIVSDIAAGTFSLRSVKYMKAEPAEVCLSETAPYGCGERTLYGRYVPLLYYIKEDEGGSIKLPVPAADSSGNKENIFLYGNKILNISAEKTGNPVLVITGIEQYTYIQ